MRLLRMYSKVLIFSILLLGVSISAVIIAIEVKGISIPLLLMPFYGLCLLVVDWLYGLFYWLDPISFFIISYYVFIVVGAAFYNWYNLELHSLTALVVGLGLVSFLGGTFLSDLLSNPSARLRVRKHLTVNPDWRTVSQGWLLFFFLFGNALISYYYLRIGIIPLLATDAESVRVASLAGQARIPLFGYAFINVALVGLTVSVARSSLRARAGVALLILFGVAMLLGIGYRSLGVKVLLSTFIAYFFVRRERLPVLPLAGVGGAIMILLGLVGYYRLTGNFVSSFADIQFAFQRVIWAMFVRYLYICDLIIGFFPTSSPFMLGKSYGITLATLFPGEQSHFGYWLRDELGLVLSSPGPVDPTIIGEFYVNFGLLGVLIGMFALGFIIRLIYLWVRGKGVISYDRVIFLTLFSTSVINIVASGIISVLLFDLLPLLSVFILYNLSRRMSRGTFGRLPEMALKGS